jgi:hypothetical protein
MSITAELVKMLHELSDKFLAQGNLRLRPSINQLYLRFNFIT